MEDEDEDGDGGRSKSEQPRPDKLWIDTDKSHVNRTGSVNKRETRA